MIDFDKAKEKFFTEYNVEKLINQLKEVDKVTSPDLYDYNAFGCEFILNGINSHSGYWSAASFISDDYEKVGNHYIQLTRDWETYLFYNPTDIRGLLFDFSCLFDKGIILSYDGLSLPITHEVVRKFTINEFLNEYGLNRLYSCTHWRVSWKNIGYSWNN